MRMNMGMTTTQKKEELSWIKTDSLKILTKKANTMKRENWRETMTPRERMPPLMGIWAKKENTKVPLTREATKGRSDSNYHCIFVFYEGLSPFN